MIEKKIVRSYQNFNAKLYNPKADSGERNSGEVKIDATGYVPLEQLLVRCGIGRQLNMNVDFEVRPGLDKFNDNIDLVQDRINRLNAAEEQAIQEFVKKKNSANSRPQQEKVHTDDSGTSEKK